MTIRAQTTAFGPAALIAPAHPEDFFREHWERKPLHLSRGDARYYDSILTNDDLERIKKSITKVSLSFLFKARRTNEANSSSTHFDSAKRLPL